MFLFPHWFETVFTVKKKAKVHRHLSLQAAHIPVPVRRLSHLHIDLVGPLPRSSGFSYLFTVIDRKTRWPDAIPLASTTAADCAAALLQGWIQRFGVPTIIPSDRGPQFTSSLWVGLCSLLSISHTQTTAYHPQSNGLMERFHRRLKDALRARAAGADWFLHLPWVLLGFRTSRGEDSEFSPSEAVFGSQLVLPGQFLSVPESPSPSFLQDFQGVLAGRSPLQTHHHTTPSPTALPEDLLLSRFVLVRRDAVQPRLSPLYDGPFRGDTGRRTAAQRSTADCRQVCRTPAVVRFTLAILPFARESRPKTPLTGLLR